MGFFARRCVFVLVLNQLTTDRGDLPRATAELFFRTVKKDKSGGKPFFVLDGVTYIHLSALGTFLAHVCCSVWGWCLSCC